jgi:hypothetical protein
MNRRQAATAAVLLTLIVSACASPGSGASTVADSGAPSSGAPTSNPPAGSIALPDGETGFPLACGVVTADELEEVVGNPLADGTGFTNLICSWSSDAEETSVSLLLQPLPEEFCPDGLPEGEATDQFGGPATIHYDDLGGIPGAQVGVCVEGGLVLVTITGGYSAASDEARYTGEAVEVMELVLEGL